jgi:hypothetical protein
VSSPPGTEHDLCENNVRLLDATHARALDVIPDFDRRHE